MIAMAAYIDAKYIRQNDYIKAGSILKASIHIMDTVSDIFLQSLYLHFISRSWPSDLLQYQYLLHYQLYHATNKWKRSDELSRWISDNISILYIVSVLSGSSFAGIAICTSNAFGLYQTSMPLDKTQLLTRKQNEYIL